MEEKWQNKTKQKNANIVEPDEMAFTSHFIWIYTVCKTFFLISGDVRVNYSNFSYIFFIVLFVCVEVLRPSQPNGVMSSAVSLPNHTFTGQA